MNELKMLGGIALFIVSYIVYLLLLRKCLKDGKFSFSYDSAGSKNAVELVKAVLSGLPATIKLITK